MEKTKKSHLILAMNTIAFTVCFAVWMLNGVLVTYLVDNQVFNWSLSQMGFLIGTPVLTGSLMRLPLGMATDKFGGRPVYTLLMLFAAVPMFALAYVDSYAGFFLCSLGFGLTGASFAVGIAFTSVWYPKSHQGTALGIFGAGNAGAAITVMGAPSLLKWLTNGGQNIDNWRTLPKIYSCVLVGMAVLFWLLTENKRPKGAAQKTIRMLLQPLKNVRVWRFGLYYFLVFGGFVALAQWLVPYYVNVYDMSIVDAGMMTAVFALPSGVIRALGGWLSDKSGPRRVLYWVLGVIAISCFFLIFPKMDIESPGRGKMARRAGTVTDVQPDFIQVDDKKYKITPPPKEARPGSRDKQTLLFPVSKFWHVPQVEIGDKVKKKQILAKGKTHIYFQANIWVFTFFVFIIGIAMGIGKAAVYKYIPDYFPNDVGVVGGIVGVLGGLGGFVCPLLFGFLLDYMGLWTTTWMFLFGVAMACVIWLSFVVRSMSTKV